MFGALAEVGHDRGDASVDLRAVAGAEGVEQTWLTVSDQHVDHATVEYELDWAGMRRPMARCLP